ncbi:DUF3418 domain-containing protein [Canibacter sp. lx-45]|uniref:DUF3418 domain-containing protein n=1 Tax=Canibacter zhuwentaonis TaxID=2837491 RepID=UPI001BDC9967|nr:DUF3418 domain-containing protein [Canibacter zhuwentaonis]
MLALEIRRAAGAPVTAADFEPERLPAHLLPNYRLVTAQDKTLTIDKDPAQLQSKYAQTAAKHCTRPI